MIIMMKCKLDEPMKTFLTLQSSLHSWILLHLSLLPDTYKQSQFLAFSCPSCIIMFLYNAEYPVIGFKELFFLLYSIGDSKCRMLWGVPADLQVVVGQMNALFLLKIKLNWFDALKAMFEQLVLAPAVVWALHQHTVLTCM